MIPGLEQGLLLAPLAISLGVIFRHLGRIDLTIDANVALSGAACWWALRHGLPAPVALLAAIAAGALVGGLLACLETRCGIDFLLGGIILQIILFSILSLTIGESKSLIGLPNLLGGMSAGSAPLLLVLGAAALATKLLWDWALTSELGLLVRAVGVSPGINAAASPRWALERVFMLHGAVIGGVGALQAFDVYSVSGAPSFGRLVDALVAVMLAERLAGGLSGLGARLRGARPIEDLDRFLGHLTTLALAGSVAFHVLVAVLLRKVPHPQLPSLLTGLTLLLVVSRGLLLPLGAVLRRPPRPGPAGAPGVRLVRLGKRFQRGDVVFEVLRDISESWPKDGLVRITGFNGAGKTTLLRVLAGRLPATEGEVLVHGLPISAAPPWHRPVFLSPQPPLDSLGGRLSVMENLALAQIRRPSLLRRGVTPGRREGALAVLRRLDIEGMLRQGRGEGGWGRRADVLSSGQAQALVVALSQLREDVSLLLLDEPTNGLDDPTAEKILDLLQRAARRCLVIIVSHDSRTEKLGGLHYRIEQGRLVAAGPEAPRV